MRNCEIVCGSTTTVFLPAAMVSLRLLSSVALVLSCDAAQAGVEPKVGASGGADTRGPNVASMVPRVKQLLAERWPDIGKMMLTVEPSSKGRTFKVTIPAHDNASYSVRFTGNRSELISITLRMDAAKLTPHVAAHSSLLLIQEWLRGWTPLSLAMRAPGACSSSQVVDLARFTARMHKTARPPESMLPLPPAAAYGSEVVLREMQIQR